MAGIVHKPVAQTDSPPAPLAENTLSLGEAVNIVNTVLATNYRAFDKVRAVLTTAQETASKQADAERALAAVQADTEKARAELADVRKQTDAAKTAKEKVLSEITARQLSADKAAEQALQALQADLALQRAHAADELKEQARVAQVNLEDAVAGLKRELGGLRKEADAARAELDKVQMELTAKRTELTSTQSKLDTAKTALDALKARL